MLTMEETGCRIYENSVQYYLCNFSVSLKLFYNENFIQKIEWESYVLILKDI